MVVIRVLQIITGHDGVSGDGLTPRRGHLAESKSKETVEGSGADTLGRENRQLNHCRFLHTDQWDTCPTNVCVHVCVGGAHQSASVLYRFMSASPFPPGTEACGTCFSQKHWRR